MYDESRLRSKNSVSHLGIRSQLGGLKIPKSIVSGFEGIELRPWTWAPKACCIQKLPSSRRFRQSPRVSQARQRKRRNSSPSTSNNKRRERNTKTRTETNQEDRGTAPQCRRLRNAALSRRFSSRRPCRPDCRGGGQKSSSGRQQEKLRLRVNPPSASSELPDSGAGNPRLLPADESLPDNHRVYQLR